MTIITKKINAIILLGLMTFFLNLNNVSAATTHYLNRIEIPFYSSPTLLPYQFYHESGYQYLKTVFTEDYQSGESRAALARTLAMFAPAGYTGWIHVPNGTTQNWGNQNSGTNQYKLSLRAKTWSIFGFYFVGEWTL